LGLLQPALLLCDDVLLESLYVHELVIIILVQNHVAIQLELLLMDLRLVNHYVIVRQLKVHCLLPVVIVLSLSGRLVPAVERLLLLLVGDDGAELLLHAGRGA